MNKVKRAHSREHTEINSRLDMLEFKVGFLDKQNNELLSIVKDLIKLAKNED